MHGAKAHQLQKKEDKLLACASATKIHVLLPPSNCPTCDLLYSQSPSFPELCTNCPWCRGHHMSWEKGTVSVLRDCIHKLDRGPYPSFVERIMATLPWFHISSVTCACRFHACRVSGSWYRQMMFLPGCMEPNHKSTIGLYACFIGIRSIKPQYD